MTPIQPNRATAAQPSVGSAGQSDPPFALALLLAALAGWVDAAGISGAGAMFVSFVSGDTTIGAIAAARHDWPRAAQIVSVIACFVAGATAGDLLDIAARPPPC